MEAAREASPRGHGESLKIISQETLHLHTFGSTAPVTVQHNIVKVSLENVWNTQLRIEIEAVETPQVCTSVIKVPGKPIQEELKRKGLQLADFPLEGTYDTELSVLIGADYYWRLVSGKVRSCHREQLRMGFAGASFDIQCNQRHLYAH